MKEKRNANESACCKGLLPKNVSLFLFLINALGWNFLSFRHLSVTAKSPLF
jgi:hypothetical protein